MRKTTEVSKQIPENTKPIVKNLTDTSFPDRRFGTKNRRNLNTYIWDDRRSGIADRRRRTGVKIAMTLEENNIK
jgi:hypothetical protein